MIILAFIVIALVAGYIANYFVGKGRGFEPWEMFVAGIVGSFVGGLIFNLIAGNGFDFEHHRAHRLDYRRDRRSRDLRTAAVAAAPEHGQAADATTRSAPSQDVHPAMPSASRPCRSLRAGSRTTTSAAAPVGAGRRRSSAGPGETPDKSARSLPTPVTTCGRGLSRSEWSVYQCIAHICRRRAGHRRPLSLDPGSRRARHPALRPGPVGRPLPRRPGRAMSSRCSPRSMRCAWRTSSCGDALRAADRARFGLHRERGPESYELTFKLTAGHDLVH